MAKKTFRFMIVAAILAAAFASTGNASASSSCPNYMTVQWGDTLSGIAVQCGTTVAAIQAANPGLGEWVYAGQVLCIPTGYASAPVSYPTYGGTYVVQWGDTLGKIAARTGISVGNILAVNPEIWNPSLIYAGQVINLPSDVSAPPYNPPPPTHPDYPAPPVDSLATLKIAYGPGMFIRSEPGGTIIASALDNTTWYYRLNSVFMDKRWKVWVEVRLYPPVKGHSTGWLLVKDQLGKYFTDPQIDPY
jgi:LysM repeat protein